MTTPLPLPEAVSARLLPWYRAVRRSLPWRDEPTLYRVLLSELMLQQTRVETALPYFERFVARWPTVHDLAAASEDEVLGEWSGLGYYSRARNLRRAAQVIASVGPPTTVAALRALPGVGPYTAGAIGSIALGLRTPLVDGNVERVLSRLDAREQDPRSTGGKRALWERAEALLPPDAGLAGDHNQALMELGATICKPRSPLCGDCPLGELCLGRGREDLETLPRKVKKKPPERHRAVAGLLLRGGAVLCGRRPDTGLLAGLWEPVGSWLTEPAERSEVALTASYLERVGLAVKIGAKRGAIVHVFSHRHLTVDVYDVHCDDVRGADALAYYTDLSWVDPHNPEVALSTLARRTLALAAGSGLLAADGSPTTGVTSPKES